MTDTDTTTGATSDRQRKLERLRLLFKAQDHDYDAIAQDPDEGVPRIRLSATSKDELSDALSRAVHVFGGFVNGPFDAPERVYVEAHDADPDPESDDPTGVEYRLEREWIPESIGDIDEEFAAELEAKAHDTEVLL